MKFLLLALFLNSTEYGYSNDLVVVKNDGKHISYGASKLECHHRPEGIQCLGNTLPYSSFSNRLVNKKFGDFEDAEEKLQELETAARFYRECWQVIQPMLCSVFKPPCHLTTTLLESYKESLKKPCRYLCTEVENHCEELMSSEVWPEFLTCDNNDIFGDKDCVNPLESFEWNDESECPEYLVPSSIRTDALAEFPGCRIGCHDPFYSDEEHLQMRVTIFWLSTICALINILSILTYMINWDSGTYPDRALYNLNWSSLLFCAGWLLQFFPFSFDDIVCNSDGSLRTFQSLLTLKTVKDLPCLATFALIYYSTMAMAMRFLILSFIWFMKLETINRKSDKISELFDVIGCGSLLQRPIIGLFARSQRNLALSGLISSSWQ
ncbi:protein smoothened-like [Cotesia glomerata]|uniref:protein smoothened-like n=1 Tax=Cotesia glomerata TaxID=32391 RepID=UPI001D02EF49|nr:protein smoothened-like [Cotesia glomerata]